VVAVTYAVIGCSECAALWIVDIDEGGETTECPACRTRTPLSKRKQFATVDDRATAAEVRGSMLASRQGHDDQYASLDDYRTLGELATDGVIDDDALLNEYDITLDKETSTAPTSTTSTTGIDRPDVEHDIEPTISPRAQLAHGADTEPGVSIVEPFGQRALDDGIVLDDVAPQRSTWLPELLDALLPATGRLVQDLAADRHPDALEGYLEAFVDELATDVGEIDTADSTAAGEEARAYIDAAARYALDWARPEYREARAYQARERYERVRWTLTTTGTSEGQFNAGLDALKHSLVALHQERKGALTVTLRLDSTAWQDARADTVRRSLEALALLAQAFDLQLRAAPQVLKRLQRIARTGDALECFLDLTDGRDASGVPAPVGDAATDEDLARDAWDAVLDLADSPGRLRLLNSLRARETRAHGDLAADVDVELSRGTVDRYVGNLEEQGLVAVDRSSRPHGVSLTSLGRAARDYVAEDGRIVWPDQSTLDVGLTDTPNSPTSTVYPASQQEEGGDGHPGAEEWLAMTGDAPDAGFVQWLDGPSGPFGRLDAWGMHQRYAAQRRTDGITLVDDEIAEFEDGRVAYASVFEDELLVMTEWGGPLATLGRLATTLTAPKVLSKILSPSAVGDGFREVVPNDLEEDVERILRLGKQVGWISNDDVDDYDAWRDRWAEVRWELLGDLGEATRSQNEGARAKLFEAFHGLLASATALLDGADVDVTINLRIPDTEMLRRLDESRNRYQQFLTFLAKTVPKQSQYGVHSWYRMAVEERPEKLETRLPYEVDPEDAAADLTASWVVTGPSTSLMQEDIEDTLEGEHVRERIEEGVEDAAHLDIPVVQGNGRRALLELIDEWTERKGYGTAYGDREAMLRLLEATLSTEERAASPADVAEVFLSIAQRDGPRDRLTTEDLKYGLSCLGERLFPSLKPTMRKMIAALLASDEPLGRSDLIEAAGISGTSYDKNWRELAALGFLEKDADAQWHAFLEPWWVPTTSMSAPRYDDPATPDAGGEGTPGLVEWLYELSLHVDHDADGYELFLQPVDVGEVFDELGLARYRPIIEAFVDDVETGPPPVATLGRPPGARSPGQTTLAD